MRKAHELASRIVSAVVRNTSSFIVVASAILLLGSVQRARANAIFYVGECSLATCTTAVASDTGGNTTANWISMSGTANDLVTGFAYVAAEGPAIGSWSTDEDIPVSFDFSVTGAYDLEASAYTYRVYFYLNNNSAMDYQSEGDFSSPGYPFGPITETGSGFIHVPANTPITDWEMQITVTGSFNQLVIPAGATLDLNPATESATPEPATFALFAVPLAAICVRIRRSRGSLNG